MIISKDGIPGHTREEINESETMSKLHTECLDGLEAALLMIDASADVAIPIIKTITSQVCAGMIEKGLMDGALDKWEQEAETYKEMMLDAIRKRRLAILTNSIEEIDGSIPQ
jgi:hypothetical protein